MMRFRRYGRRERDRAGAGGKGEGAVPSMLSTREGFMFEAFLLT